MGQVKKINTKNRGYYFRVDMINIKKFHSNLLKIDKKSHEDINIYYISDIIRGNLGTGGALPPPPPLIFWNHLFFAITLKNYKLSFLKLNWSLINAPLIYVYPNTTKTCLTPNYLLFGKQLLVSSNTTLTVAANVTVTVRM